MDSENLELNEPLDAPSKVDPNAERIIMAQYQREAHQKNVEVEISRIRRNQTIMDAVWFCLAVGIIYASMRMWVLPAEIRSFENWLIEMTRK